MKLKYFCCCCNVSKGAVIIGIFEMFCLVLLMPTIIILTHRDEKYQHLWLKTIIVILSSVTISDILLFIGFLKGNQYFALPWLMLHILIYCACTVYYFGYYFHFIVILHQSLDKYNTLWFFIFLIIIAVFWYCWICIWSFYRETKERVTTIVATNSTIELKSYINEAIYIDDKRNEQEAV